jgi:hypothetical protein
MFGRFDHRQVLGCLALPAAASPIPGRLLPLPLAGRPPALARRRWGRGIWLFDGSAVRVEGSLRLQPTSRLPLRWPAGAWYPPRGRNEPPAPSGRPGRRCGDGEDRGVNVDALPPGLVPGRAAVLGRLRHGRVDEGENILERRKGE